MIAVGRRIRVRVRAKPALEISVAIALEEAIWGAIEVSVVSSLSRVAVPPARRRRWRWWRRRRVSGCVFRRVVDAFAAMAVATTV